MLCLDEKTGKILWTQEWPADYGKAGVTFHAEGPRAVPTVDGDRVYVQGGTGHLAALKVTNGEVLWTKDYMRDYGTDFLNQGGNYGAVSPPIVDGAP